MTELNNDVQLEEEIPADDSAQDGDEELSLVEKIIGVYTSPVRTFKYLAMKPDFLSAFIVISLISIALGLALTPKIMPVVQAGTIAKMQEEFSKTGTSENEQQVIIDTVKKTMAIAPYAQAVIGTPITLCVIWLLVSIVIFFLGMFMGHEPDFKRLMGVVPWVTFISILSQIITTVLLMRKEFNSMEQMNDMGFMKPISLAAVIPGVSDMPAFTSAILASVDPFTIWSLIVMVFAIEAANKSSRAHAWIISVVLYVITIAMGSGLAAWGAMFQQAN